MSARSKSGTSVGSLSPPPSFRTSPSFSDSTPERGDHTERAGKRPRPDEAHSSPIMELPEETTDDLRIMTQKIGMLVSKVSERLNITAEGIAEHVLHHKDIAVRGKAQFSEIRLENFLRSKVGMGGQSHLAATKMIEALIYYTDMKDAPRAEGEHGRSARH